MSGTKRSRDGARSWMEEMTRDKTGPDGERALGKYSLGDECRIDLREREADERKRCGGEGAQRQRHEREDQRLQQSPSQLTHHSKWRVATNATQPARWRTLPSDCPKARLIGSPVRVHRAADVRARARWGYPGERPVLCESIQRRHVKVVHEEAEERDDRPARADTAIVGCTGGAHTSADHNGACCVCFGPACVYARAQVACCVPIHRHVPKLGRLCAERDVEGDRKADEDRRAEERKRRLMQPRCNAPLLCCNRVVLWTAATKRTKDAVRLWRRAQKAAGRGWHSSETA